MRLRIRKQCLPRRKANRKGVGMERIALIGLGTIARYYEKGLKNSPLFRLVATVDLDENARERARVFIGRGIAYSAP